MWKNFVIATRFIVAILHAKTNVMSDSKSNSTPTRQIISRFYRSAGLIVIHSMTIPLVIIRTFSRNLNWKYCTYECRACTATVCTCRSRAKIARLVHLLISFITLAIAIKLLWVRFVINSFVLVHSLVLISRLYPTTTFCLWIISYTTNMKMGWQLKLFFGSY